MPRSSAGQGGLAAARCEALARLFGDRLYVELQRHGARSRAHGRGGAGRTRLCAQAFRWSRPTSRIFATAEDYEAHDALHLPSPRGGWSPRPTAASSPPSTASRPAPRWRRCSPTCRRRSPRRSRSRSAAPSGRATLAPILPRFSVGESDAAVDEAAELRRQAAAGLERRLAVHGLAPGRTVEDYRERLDFELGVIERMKYPGYFLIVADFIQWAKAQRIPVGPGRGSGAGSLVAYALTITDLDPIRFGLLFERFLNPERISMPDFDIDFCQDRRDEVIRYVQGKYGQRPGGADHHLRHAAGARRAARRRPRAADALRAGRQALQARAAEPGQSGLAQARDRGRAAAAGRARPRSGGASAPSTSRRSSKGCTATPRPMPPAS